MPISHRQIEMYSAKAAREAVSRDEEVTIRKKTITAQLTLAVNRASSKSPGPPEVRLSSLPAQFKKAETLSDDQRRGPAGNCHNRKFTTSPRLRLSPKQRVVKKGRIQKTQQS